MRYIDIDRLECVITPKWEEEARKAYKNAKNPPPRKTRAEVINSNSKLWSNLKEELKKLSHGKCWYCESFAHRLIGDVDHYRPKNEIKHYPPDSAIQDLPGYWWLAFCWRNYRFTCERCNRRNRDLATNFVGGKWSYFPLLNAEKRVCEECEYEDLLAEEPLLLDPTDTDDPPLLTFGFNGQSSPAYNEGECPENYRRAKISIELYHLNHVDLKTGRREVCYKVRNLVQKVDRYSKKWQADKSDTSARACVKEATAELKRMIHESAQYSAAAVVALETFGKTRKWIRPLLTA